MSSVIANSKAPGETAGHKFLSMLQTANEILQYCGIFLLLGALVLGYVNRDDGYLSAANGIGYWLGIAGGCMMMLLLTYSIRKRNKHLRRVFKLRH